MAATKDQIKKEFFLSVLKGPYEPAVNDVIVEGIVNKDLYKKFQCEITTDEFNDIGDELEAAGYCKWNDDGHLALTAEGLEYLLKYHKS